MIKVIEAKFGIGAKIEETKLAPAKIMEYLNFAHSTAICALRDAAHVPLGKERLKSVADFSTKLGDIVKKALALGEFPIVVGGDHSVAIGTWSAVTSANVCEGDFGLIWIDAHLDSHNYETSPSKAYHGMPAAALLGNGEPQLVSMFSDKVKIPYKYIVFIGARDFETEEHEFLKSRNVKIYYMKDVHERGLADVFSEALKTVSQAGGGYGVSIDMDAFDPKFAPGVGSPAPGGLAADDFMRHFSTLITPKLKALEIVECNPQLDVDDKTSKLAAGIINLTQSCL